MRQNISRTGGGPPPPQPKLSEDEEMVRGFISKDLAMPSQAIEFGVVHPVDDQGEIIPDIYIGEIPMLLYRTKHLCKGT